MNYNSSGYAEECIRSVYEHSKGLSFEIILVDNNSESFSRSQFDQFPNIVIIENEENLGFAKANNVGIASAKGSTILLLNVDTKLLANTLYESWSFLKDKGDEIGFVGARLINDDGTHQQSHFPFPNQRTEFLRAFRIQKLWHKLFAKKGVRSITGQFEQTDWISGAYIHFDKKLLDEFPDTRLHETFFMYIEDIQWAYYVKKDLGKKVIYLNSSEVIHYGGKTLPMNLFEKRLRFYFPHMKVFLSKNRGEAYARLFFVFLLIRHLSLYFKKSTRKPYKQLIRLTWNSKLKDQYT